MNTKVTKKQGSSNMSENSSDIHSIKTAILNALLRVCQEDIRVTVIGHKAILEGAVESMEERMSVENVVLHVPQIKEVENKLRIEWIC